MTTLTPTPTFKRPDTSDYEMPGYREHQEQTQRLMMDAFDAVIRQVLESCLGREFTPADADRFVLGVPASNPMAYVIVFDDIHICTISGEFVTEDDRTVYRVSAKPPTT